MAFGVIARNAREKNQKKKRKANKQERIENNRYILHSLKLTNISIVLSEK